MSEQAGFLEWDDPTYFGDTTYLSNSMLSTFIQSPALYAAKYLDKLIADEPSDAMRLGSLVHCLATLGEDEARKQFFVNDTKIDRRRKGWEELVVKLEQEMAGRTLVTAEEWEQAHAMVEAIEFNDTAACLLGALEMPEKVIWWAHQTGARCKAKIDGVSDGVIVDLKTSSNPYPVPFQKSLADFGYYRQAAWYQAGIEAVTGERLPFVFVVIGKSFPHEVFVYQVNEEDLALGRDHCDRVVGKILRSTEQRNWQHPDADGVRELSLPKWFRASVEI